MKLFLNIKKVIVASKATIVNEKLLCSCKRDAVFYQEYKRMRSVGKLEIWKGHDVPMIAIQFSPMVKAWWLW